MPVSLVPVPPDGLEQRVAAEGMPGPGTELRQQVELLGGQLDAFAATDEYKAAADVLMPALLPLYESLDPDTDGGAMLLGVDGVCIISHGSSSERAIVNAIGVARDMVEHEVVAEITRAIRTDAD